MLYSLGFAALVFTALPLDTGRSKIRRAFPHFYLFVLTISAGAVVIAAVFDQTTGKCQTNRILVKSRGFDRC